MAKNPDFGIDDDLDLRLRDALLEKAMRDAKEKFNKVLDKAKYPEEVDAERDAFTAAKLELREFRQFWRTIRAEFYEPGEGDVMPEPLKTKSAVKDAEVDA